MKLTTKLNQLDNSSLRQLGKVSLEFCKEELRINHRHSNEIKFHIRKSRIPKNSENICLGQYNPYVNKIFIYKNVVSDVETFLLTFIHEYVHSMQPIKTKYNSLLNKHGYNNHPYEIEADYVSLALYKKLWRYYKNSTK
jgi:hypothetical protein